MKDYEIRVWVIQNNGILTYDLILGMGVIFILYVKICIAYTIFLCVATSAEIDFYLALYASVVQEPKHIMARWHFCNFRQLLCLGSA